MTFTATDPNTHQSENTWYTPRWLLEALGGPFDLDPCTMSTRPYDVAREHYCHDLGQDGLVLPWRGEVWLNPPYGREILPFIDKFIEHKGGGIALVYARTGAEFFQRCLSEDFYFFFFRKRVRFIDKSGKEAPSNPGADSCLIVKEGSIERVFKSGLRGKLIQSWNEKL